MKHLVLGLGIAAALSGCAGGNITVSPAKTAVAAIDAKVEKPAVLAVETPAVVTPVATEWLGAAATSEYIVSGSEQAMGVWVDVPAARSHGHVPMALVLAIDTSGSMGGEKILRAREAAAAVVRGLHDGDLVTIQEFSDSVKELVPPTAIDARTREQMLGTIAELDAHGGTNLFDGLREAERRAVQAPLTHPVRRVVLISDGRATVGTTDTAVLADLAERGEAHGVQVSSFGVGLDYDESALNALAVRSSGRLFHLSDPRELTGIVESELGLLQSTMATAAEVEIVPAPGVVILGVNGVRSMRESSGSVRVPLGTLFSGQRRELLVRVRLDEFSEGKRAISSVRLHFRDPLDGGLERVREVVVRAEPTRDAALAAAHPVAETQAIVAVLSASELATVARDDAGRGDLTAASDRLDDAEKKLRDSAHLAKSKKDEARMLQFADNMAKTRESVHAAAAAPAPARAQAARKSSLEANAAAMKAAGF